MKRENWYRDLWLAAISAALLAGAIDVRGTVREVDGLVSAVQHSRLEASQRACEQRNDQNRAIVAFIERLDLELEQPRLVEHAKRSFPIERDCEAFARRQVLIGR